MGDGDGVDHYAAAAAAAESDFKFGLMSEAQRRVRRYTLFGSHPGSVAMTISASTWSPQRLNDDS